MTPASHSNQETAGNPGSNPGGRTTISFSRFPARCGIGVCNPRFCCFTFWSPTISEPRLDQLVGWGLCLINTNNFHIIPRLLFDSGCSRKLCGKRDSVKRVAISFNDRVAGCWIDKHVTTRFFKPSSATNHRRNYWSYCGSWGRRVSDKTQKVTLAALSRPDLFWTTRGCSALGYSPKLLITLPEFPSITRTILVPL